ncbi:MAG: MarR family transcriptional regulator [Opitutales bacterium]|jgi:DNA-binding MarR family transcriptional regulator
MNEQQIDPETAHLSLLAGNIRVVIGKLGRRLREQTNAWDLPWSQVSVLARLERDGPATVTTLARAEGVRPQSMCSTVSILQAAGFVTGEPDPNDGRQIILSITDACREKVREGRASRQDWLFRSIKAMLTAEEHATLAAAVELLARIADLGPDATNS